MTANRKVTARYAEIARFLGLHFNEEFCVAYGEKDGFTLRAAVLILAGVSSTVWSAYQSVWLRTA